jgi:hypothetical protein
MASIAGCHDILGDYPGLNWQLHTRTAYYVAVRQLLIISNNSAVLLTQYCALHTCLHGADPDKDWSSQEPLCRVNIKGDVDLTRYHVQKLSECIDHCKAVPACKGLTFGYGALSEDIDNCWLKGATNSSNITPEKDYVRYVSLFKPETPFSCFTDTKCSTGFAFGLIGAVFGLVATVLSIINSKLINRGRLTEVDAAQHQKNPRAQGAHPTDAPESCAHAHGKADDDVKPPMSDQSNAV